MTADDVEAGRWRINPPAADGLGLDPDYAEEHLRYYTRTLEEGGKYNLTIWPFHAMLGGIGYALVSALEEALFFHSIARSAPLDFQPKGDNPLTEHYSMLGPEVEYDREGEPLGKRNQPLIERLLQFDAVVIAGEAKSHCVAWTIEDLLSDPTVQERGLAGEGLPARGLHLARRRSRLGRLHRRGRRPFRPLRRVGRARRPLRPADARSGPASSASRSQRRLGDELEPRVRPVAAADLRRRAGRRSCTMSAVKSFWPRISDEPIPYASTGTPADARTPRSCRR